MKPRGRKPDGGYLEMEESDLKLDEELFRSRFGDRGLGIQMTNFSFEEGDLGEIAEASDSEEGDADEELPPLAEGELSDSESEPEPEDSAASDGRDTRRA